MPRLHVCRKYGISRATYYEWKATYYEWKATYGGMNVSQLEKLRALQTENAKLKKMYAELARCM